MIKSSSRFGSLLMRNMLVKNRWQRRFFSELRAQLVRFVDPPVDVELGSLKLQMPLSHQLPIYSLDHPEYDKALGRIVELISRTRDTCNVIDIGANIGDTAKAMLSAGATRVLCIEGNRTFSDFISTNLSEFEGRYVLVDAFAAIGDEPLFAALEEARGTARITLSRGTTALDMISLDSALERTGFPAPDFIKIDTDGLDTRILRAELPFLCRHHPIIFFEYDPTLFIPNDTEGKLIFDRLSEIGYGFSVVYRNTGEFIERFSNEGVGVLSKRLDALRANIGAEYFDICMFSSREDCDLVFDHESSLARREVEPAGGGPQATGP